MCNGIAIIVVKVGNDIKVYCDPTNGSHDKLLSDNVPIEYHNSYIKVEYIFPGVFQLDCPDSECQTVAIDTGLVENAFPNILRLKPSTIVKIAESVPNVVSWPKELMQFANLYNADLRNANLYNANLRFADLRNADLRNANLQFANLYNANLQFANLYNADLRNADLYNADLQFANLYNADLRNADLRNANLPDPVGGKFDITKVNEYREKLNIII